MLRKAAVPKRICDRRRAQNASKIILTTETDVEVLEEATNYFQNMNIYIWWNPNSFKQQSRIL